MNRLIARLREFLEDLSLRKAIALALIIGLAVPVGISTFMTVTERRATLLERLKQDHARIVDVLASGMQAPLWEIRPDAGRPLLEAVMLDQRVTAIHVSSPLVPEFLVLEAPRSDVDEILSMERPVMHEGDEIGRVRVDMNAGAMKSQLTVQWVQTLLSGFLQFGTGILIIFALLRYKVLGPLQRLIGQSQALAAGTLDQAWTWRRGDELGVLGRSFEEMRRSLRELFFNLQRRNQDLKKREAELAGQASILKAILDNMTDGITLVDPHLHLVAWNNRFTEIMGIPGNRIHRGISIEELAAFDLSRGQCAPLDRDATLKTIRNSYHSDRPYAIQYKTADSRWINIRRRPMPGGGYVSTYTDITEQHQARHKADQTLQLLEAVMDAVPAMLHVKDRDLRYQMVNREFLECWGFKREEFLNKISREVFPEDMSRLVEARDRQVLETGRPLPFAEITYQGHRPEPITVWSTKVPLIDAGGRVTHIVTVDVDISERKKADAELARHREALHQSEKLSALGSLLAGVAHELNNPLSVVVGRAIMLEEEFGDSDLARSIAKIRTAAERCARIVKTFLAMARRQEPARVPVQIREVIESSLELVGYGLRANGVEVSLEVEPDLPDLMADPDQLTQVFTNLFVNAQQALITTSPPRRLAISARFNNRANALRIRVIDNGPGIPREILPRIFEPFFTTKPVGEGTGLGLSVSQGIIEAHGGIISAELPAGGGTAFELTLPVQAAGENLDAETDTAPDTARARRILIVDDVPEIAQMLADILDEAGHHIELAENGRVALERLEQNDFDLIISDLRMPELDGPGLYAELQSRHPRLSDRLIFITGDTLSEPIKRFLTRANRPVIEKPFIPKEIRRLVARVLEQDQTSPRGTKI